MAGRGRTRAALEARVCERHAYTAAAAAAVAATLREPRDDAVLTEK